MADADRMETKHAATLEGCILCQTVACSQSLVSLDQMKSRARKGVPKCLRGQVWPRLASEYATAPLAGCAAPLCRYRLLILPPMPMRAESCCCSRYAVLSKQVTEFEEQIR